LLNAGFVFARTGLQRYLKMKGHDAGRREHYSQNIATNTRWPIAAIEPSAPS
jgi:hypothetical protein